MKFEDRYANAINASNLKSDPRTTHSSSDIIGAAGLAAKLNPLAIALMRLFAGDIRSVREIVDIMTASAIGKAYRLGQEIEPVDASELALMVLAYYRNSVCKDCGGLGFEQIVGAPKLSAKECHECGGTGKRKFGAMFAIERLELARWLAAELERETALAGPAAMAALAPRLDL